MIVLGHTAAYTVWCVVNREAAVFCTCAARVSGEELWQFSCSSGGCSQDFRLGVKSV